MKIKLDYQIIKNLKLVGRHTTDERGLQLLIKESGKKYWVIRYAYGKKRHDLSVGTFPEQTIKYARSRAQEVRVKLNQGINPLEEKRALKEAIRDQALSSVTFEQFALEVIQKKCIEWSNAKHAAQWGSSLRMYAFPFIGKMRLDEIEMDHILMVLTPIWEIKTETASRLRARLEWILAAATTKGLRKGVNPALWRGLLQTVLPSPKRFMKVKHHKALSVCALPEFITRLRELDGAAVLALEFLILNANRTSEVTDALRSEIVGDVWIIPAERMKARVEHRVPLCKRSLELLAMAREQDSQSPLLFSKDGKKLHNMSMAQVLRRMKVDVTIHGFRSTFRDWVSEFTNHSPEVSEKALAHTIRNKVEAAYRRGDLLDRRRDLMIDWEFFCSRGEFKNVIELRAA
jgi:integrase